MTIPVDVIDPDAVHREWVHAFEYHLDQVPPLMETMSVLNQTIISAARIDQVRVTGGGYFNAIPVADGSVGADAEELWRWLVAYTRAVVAWITPAEGDMPAIASDVRTWTSEAPRPNADPLTARSVALVTIGWLIDHAAVIEPVHELDDHRDAMFTVIRRLARKHRGGGRPRRASPRVCGVCGECAVLVDWVDAANGSPKPVQVGKCRVCGQTYTGGAAPSGDLTEHL